MTMYIHELKQGRKTFWIWTISIALFMAMCIFLYPEMQGEMENVSDMFSSMGAFSTAFGMDKLNFGTLIGFYAVECGNILSVGGAFFAAIVAVNILSKEEKEHTAEFLFSHPVSRSKVMAGKMGAVLTEITLMNLIVTGITVASVMAIGESLPWKEVLLLHLAYFLCQLELAMISFGISAFSRGNNYGIGLGMALILYFMSILANVSDKAKICKVISPFGYAEGSDIVSNAELDVKLIVLGMVIGLCCALAGAWHYRNKDFSC